MEFGGPSYRRYGSHLRSIDGSRMAPAQAPPAPHRRGRPWRDPRDVLNGILWILRTGAPWKDLPNRYPSYQTWAYIQVPTLAFGGAEDMLLGPPRGSRSECCTSPRPSPTATATCCCCQASAT